MIEILKSSNSFLAIAILSFAPQPVFAKCLVDSYEIAVDASIDVALSARITARIQKPDQEEIRMKVLRDGIDIDSYTLDAYWGAQNEWGGPPIITTDVNNDGTKELLIGTGRGMVNSFYTMYIFNLDGTLHTSVELSDPEFCKTDRGFHSWHRSGPRGVDTYWAINANGIPYRQISQAIVDDIVSHRVIYAEDGTVIRQSIVPNETGILANTPSFTAVIVAKDGRAPVYDPQDSQREIARLSAKSPVVLLGVDDTYSMFLIELSQGKRGWVMLENVSYK